MNYVFNKFLILPFVVCFVFVVPIELMCAKFSISLDAAQHQWQWCSACVHFDGHFASHIRLIESVAKCPSEMRNRLVSRTNLNNFLPLNFFIDRKREKKKKYWCNIGHKKGWFCYVGVISISKWINVNSVCFSLYFFLH